MVYITIGAKFVERFTSRSTPREFILKMILKLLIESPRKAAFTVLLFIIYLLLLFVVR